MPQMAPMSWITLFLLFSFLLIMINMMNYYSYTPKMLQKLYTNKLIIQNKFWKW